MIVSVRRYPQGPRVWIVGQRVHHGSVGVVLCASLLSRRARALALVGLILAAHDAHDWRVWFVREGLPESAGITLDFSTPSV